MSTFIIYDWKNYKGDTCVEVFNIETRAQTSCENGVEKYTEIHEDDETMEYYMNDVRIGQQIQGYKINITEK